jgi:hypothetical protein
MYAALTGEDASESYEFLESGSSAPLNIDAFTRDSILEFGYCTEFLLRLQTAKVDPDSFDVGEIIAYLESIGGESIVSYKTGDVVKVHVHTENPGLVLTKVREYGELLTVKIENMSLQHNDTDGEKKKREHTPLAIVAVASGEGMSELFLTIGADKIISGGQTQNPSAEDFIKHVDIMNDPDFVACLDLGHAEMRGSGDGAVNMIHKLGHRLQALHIHDNDRWHDDHQIPFSMDMDFVSIVKALKEIDYKGYFTLEADSFLKIYTEDNVFEGVKKLAESARKLADMFEQM